MLLVRRISAVAAKITLSFIPSTFNGTADRWAHLHSGRPSYRLECSRRISRLYSSPNLRDSSADLHRLDQITVERWHGCLPLGWGTSSPVWIVRPGRQFPFS